jgi:Gas vesicle synthesis protein GvpL/GvpF
MTRFSKSPLRSPRNASDTPRALYLYAISAASAIAAPAIAAEGIDGSAAVESIACENYLCWISRVPKAEFADHLPDRMQDLEWLATAGLRHQRAVSEISARLTALPARFGTVFLSENSLAQHLRERKTALKQAFARVADADEWGIKVFATAKPKARTAAKATSGADYLKRKAEMLQPRTGKLDQEVTAFIAALTELAVATSPGGKASAGQPGMVWHGSFLIRRSDRKKLEAALKKYAGSWKDKRRIDCSGPWPPYSFVDEHAH